jgi:ribosomal protein S6--L-glutamate ligase
MTPKLDLLGSEEWCAFEQIGIPAVKARIDSGARTSSIQSQNAKVIRKDGEEWVRFELNPLQENRSLKLICEAQLVDRRLVKSSSGVSEERLVVKTEVKVGEQRFELELTLANRDTMEYRMLLGREALNERFLVDPSRSFVQGDLPDDELDELYKPYMPDKTGLRIAVLASNPQLYSNKRLMEAGLARGHEMVFLNVEHSYMKLDTKEPEVRYRGGNVLNKFDAVIPRIKPAVTFYGCAMLRQFDTLGVYCQNSADAISKSRDKLYASQIFAKNDLHIPTTGFAKSPIDTKDLIRMVNGAPLILKLLESTQGKGVVLAETDKAAESVINAFKSLKTNILVQEFIKEANGSDIRCFVIDGKVVASIERRASKGEFRSNIHMGGQASKVRISPEERKLAVRAAKAMNLAVAGVDIIRSNRGPLLLEVNSSPGLEGIEIATGLDIANLMIKSVEKKLKFSLPAVEAVQE